MSNIIYNEVDENIIKKFNYLASINFKKKFPDLYQILSVIDPNFSISKYMYIHHMSEHPKCPYCGDIINGFNSTTGFYGCCSKKECKNKLTGLGVKKVFETYDFTERNEKIKQTCLEKYGVYNVNSLLEIKNKKIKTSIEKYGSLENMYKIKRERHKYTCLEKYGSSNNSNMHINEFTKNIINDSELFKKFIENKTITEITNNLNITASMVNKLEHKYNCLNLRIKENTPKSTEKPIIDFLNINKINFISHDRTELYPKEIDIYLPDYKIGIECNGDYWHSDINKDAKYHQEKSLLAESKGIRLIHIFEYEYNKNPDKILNWLLSQIKQDIIYARKCIIKEISSKESNDFLNEYHLQNEDKSKIKLGLFYNDELVEVMTFGKPRFNKKYEYELIRLCTRFNYKVIGGASKLFKYFIDKYNPKSIISYQNFSKFNGNIYFNLGFKYKELSAPNYVYVNKEQVLSRYQCQKHKLIKQYPEYKDLTESQIMDKLDYLKIYDSGNKVWIFK